MSYIEILTIAANNIGLKASLLISVCSVESNLKTVSNTLDPNEGSHGICQVSLRTARELIPNINKQKLLNPYINAHLAAKILKQKVDKYGLELGIASYNSGSPLYKNGVLKNQKYLDKVLKIHNGGKYGK